MEKPNLHLINDIDPQHKETLLDMINVNTRFSVSYIVLLIASTIISTLGLLIGSPATIIGGMIIAPLMWPLVKIGMGISLARKSYIIHAVYLLVGSLALIVGTAFLIAFISPLKGINPEIIARSQPTLLDLFIALAAGMIAALALIHKRISSSLAGVAIATSLLPPLCVTGIGIALSNMTIASGSFLLFTANAVSIIFIAIFVFRFAGITSHGESEFKNQSILFVAIMLAITALPLFAFLQEYSFKATAYQKTEKVLQQTFEEISPDIIVSSVKTNITKQKNLVSIEADILVPEGIALSLEQKEDIIKQLEESLNRKVQLNLLVQQTIALESKSDEKEQQTKNSLKELVISQIKKIDETSSIDTITLTKENSTWNVSVVMRANPNIDFTQKDRKDIESSLQKVAAGKVNFSIDIIPRIELKSEKDIQQIQIEDEINRFFANISNEIIVTDIQFEQQNNNTKIMIAIELPKNISIKKSDIRKLKTSLDTNYKINSQPEIKTATQQTITL